MNKQILKPQRYLIIIPTFLLIMSSAAIAISLSEKFDATTFYSGLGMLLLALFVIANFYRTSIILDDHLFIYQTFLRTQILEPTEIEKIEIKVMVTPAFHGINSTKTLVLHSADKKKLVLDIKPFSRKNLIVIAQWLTSQCHRATIDERTIEMSRGKMPKIFGRK